MLHPKLFFSLSVYVAPTIVNSNAGPVNVVFGSFGGYTYDPWATLPYLQLPGWTVQSIYAIVGGLFLLYVFGLLGSSIPGVSNLFSGLSSKFNSPRDIDLFERK